MVANRIHEQPLGDLMEQRAACASSLFSFLCSSQESSSAASAARENQYRRLARVPFGVDPKGVIHGADAPWLAPCDKHRDEGGLAATRRSKPLRAIVGLHAVRGGHRDEGGANSATTSGGPALSARKIGFRHDESGVALSEALITLPIVLLVFAAFVEFGYAMSQWNQTVKALQYGARLAAVSDPLVSQAAFDAAFPIGAANPLNNGDATPNDSTISVSCGPGYAACDATRLSRVVLGSDGACGMAGDPRPGICDINWRIQPANLVVTYQRSGLGYWGRPEGPVLTMRLEVRNITFDLPLLGGLLGLDDITIPAHPVTITTEDLSTCSTC